ncbi:hypothetical protein ATO11_04485 [Pseudaestuariivita atlantica]|uniref:Uncharacterized protein n=2 Tax=Pseudaestuariivita atlantica TaxID=1317121 RepID=A0A0L1JSH8_9RHOB|nr:hypothetical protein ATO11_04485 [Pseudaestuariivita atlantica]
MMRATGTDLRPDARENDCGTREEGDSMAVALCRSGTGFFDLVAESEAELARAILIIMETVPVTAVGWLEPHMVVDRDTFRAILEPPAAPCPQRPRPSGRRRPRPTRRAALRMCADQRAEISDEVLRHGFVTEAERVELARLRKELGLPAHQHRAACHVIASTAAVIALNATQAAAGVLAYLPTF